MGPPWRIHACYVPHLECDSELRMRTSTAFRYNESLVGRLLMHSVSALSHTRLPATMWGTRCAHKVKSHALGCMTSEQLLFFSRTQPVSRDVFYFVAVGNVTYTP